MEIGIILRALVLSLSYYLIEVNFIHKSLISRVSYLLILFSIHVAIQISSGISPLVSELGLLISCIICSLYINASMKNYFKSFSIALSIHIALSVLSYFYYSVIILLGPIFIPESLYVSEVTSYIWIFLLAIGLRKYRNYYFSVTDDKNIVKYNLSFKVLIYIILCWILPFMYSIGIDDNDIAVGFTALLVISVLVSFFLAKYIVNHFNELEEEKRKAAIELARLEVESENINKRYDEIIAFKHYTTSLYRSVIEFIAANDMPGLKEYYRNNIAPVNERLNREVGEFEQIGYIEIPLIKSRIIELISTVSQLRNVDLIIQIGNKVDEVSMKEMDLFTTINIYIDNAVEEVKEQEKGQIIILMTQTYNKFVFEIKNSLNGYESTPKPKNTHRGLIIVSKILENYPNVSTFTNVEYGVYSQRLEIERV